MTFACLLFLLTDEDPFWEVNTSAIQEWSLGFVDTFQSSRFSKLLQNEEQETQKRTEQMIYSEIYRRRNLSG